MSDRKPIKRYILTKEEVMIKELYHLPNILCDSAEVMKLELHREELEKCNKLLAEVNLNNAGKIAELEKKLEIAVEALERIQTQAESDYNTEISTTYYKNIIDRIKYYDSDRNEISITNCTLNQLKGESE